MVGKRSMAEKKEMAFQIDSSDNVATALAELCSGTVTVFGAGQKRQLAVCETIPRGHKVALCSIEQGTMIIKYGVPIGQAICKIEQGQWVHLHCMKSNYDERSSHLDPITGAAQDMEYL